VADGRYRAGVLAGCALSRRAGTWPDQVPGLGGKVGGQPLARCVACPQDAHPSSATTWVRYGGHPLCWNHAKTLAGGGDLPFVAEALQRARTAGR